MKNWKRYSVLIPLLIVFAFPSPAKCEWFLDLEAGNVRCGYNDVRIPGDTGTLFSLCDDLSLKSKIAFRFRLGFQLSKKHTFFVLAAPLSINATGSFREPVVFFKETFPPNTPVDALYRFNSFRLTYRYDFVNSERWRVGLGLTAKIRDAEIKLEGGGLSSSKTNVGFVPLLNFRVEWMFDRKAYLLLEGDALASPGGQGRAEDIFLAVLYHLKKDISLKAGYRFLEGGSDVQEVYSFALFHYLIMGAEIRF